MIVITGPGRSGTSFLARVYQELGFDPVTGGGGWDPAIRGGLEDVEIAALNGRLINELGLRSPFWRLADPVRRLRAAIRPQMLAHLAAPADNGDPGGSASPVQRLVDAIVACTIGRHLRLLRWERLPDVAERYGGEMRRLALSRQVVKDPAFCLTLSTWATANAQIDHVVVSIRAIDASAAGLLRTGHLPRWAAAIARDQVIYRLGLLLAALSEHRLDYSIVRFPDFLDDWEALYNALRFPEPVSRERLFGVLETLRRPDLVSTWK
jgi:hypothetical protein